MRAASASSAGLPNTCFAKRTIVSAASTVSPGYRRWRGLSLPQFAEQSGLAIRPDAELRNGGGLDDVLDAGSEQEFVAARGLRGENQHFSTR